MNYLRYVFHETEIQFDTAVPINSKTENFSNHSSYNHSATSCLHYFRHVLIVAEVGLGRREGAYMNLDVDIEGSWLAEKDLTRSASWGPDFPLDEVKEGSPNPNQPLNFPSLCLAKAPTGKVWQRRSARLFLRERKESKELTQGSTVYRMLEFLPPVRMESFQQPYANI